MACVLWTPKVLTPCHASGHGRGLLAVLLEVGGVRQRLHGGVLRAHRLQLVGVWRRQRVG
eukprot:2367057-Pyramimonas_sp.AAC.2